MTNSSSHHDQSPPPFWRSRYAVGLLIMGAVATWYFWAEHRAHLLGALPYLILLACPLMHMFMHRGHGEHQHQRDDKSQGDRS